MERLITALTAALVSENSWRARCPIAGSKLRWPLPACVEREIAMRRQVYPRQVGQGKMKQATADLQIAAMEAVLLTLTKMRDANG